MAVLATRILKIMLVLAPATLGLTALAAALGAR
jgi:hypothetical protein